VAEVGVGGLLAGGLWASGSCGRWYHRASGWDR
jgi:hypothetical protein